MKLPSFVETFPDKFVEPRILRQAREEVAIVPQASRTPITIPSDFTASDKDPEHKLWYFREDLGMNSHHWHWHLIYPFDGPLNLVGKDRRGELFCKQTLLNFQLNHSIIDFRIRLHASADCCALQRRALEQRHGCNRSILELPSADS